MHQVRLFTRKKEISERKRDESKRILTTQFLGDLDELSEPGITFSLESSQFFLRRCAVRFQLGQHVLVFLGILLPGSTLNSKGTCQLGVLGVGAVELFLQPRHLGGLFLQLGLASLQLGLGFLLQESIVGLEGLMLGEQLVEDLRPEFIAVLRQEKSSVR